MGNQALVVFHDGEDVSPVTYLHWGGTAVKSLLHECRELMRTRGVDLPYTAARFVGLCHVATSGNTSLGMWNAPDGTGLADCLAKIESHGDAGVFIVDVRTWEVTNREGHLSEHDWLEISTGPVTLT